MRYVQIVDPGISASEAPGSYPPYDLGLQAGIFIKNSTDQPFVGKVWNTGTTVWPDFTHPEALDYWGQMLQNYYKQVRFFSVRRKAVRVLLMAFRWPWFSGQD